jgi:hypothetical protein
MTAARRLAAILAVDVGYSRPDGQGRGGHRAVRENREAARPITFTNCDVHCRDPQ